MNKEQFNNLSIEEQVKYINNQLENNSSVTSVCNIIGIGRSTIRDRFKKIQYEYSKVENKYIHKECITDVTQKHTEANTSRSKTIKEPHKHNIPNNNYNRNTPVIQDENNNSVTDVQQNNKVLDIVSKSDVEIKETIIDIVNNYDVLKEIIELHRRNTSVIKNQIIIDIEESESKLTTLRVNSKELELFNKFCDDNKQYKKIDLISQALKEFRQKYK